MLLAAFAAPVFAASPSPEEQTAMSGRWRLVEARDAVQARVDAAIEATLSPFNAVIRGLARAPLRSASFFCERYDTTLTASTFVVGCDARAAITGALGQEDQPGVSVEGSAYRLDAGWDAGGVTFRFDADGGWQRVRYRASGETFLVEKTVYAERLGTGPTWTMTYRRDEGGR